MLTLRNIFLVGLFNVMAIGAFSRTLFKEWDFSAEWDEPSSFMTPNGETIRYLNFKDAYYTNEVQPVPFYSHLIELNGAIQNPEVIINDQVWADLSIKEIQLLNSGVPENFLPQAKVSVARFKYRAVVTFFPFRKDAASGQWQKLVSGKIKLNYEVMQNQTLKSGNRSFASSSALASGSGDWYKIGVTKTGMFKVTYAMLQSLGVDMENFSSSWLNLYGNSFGMLPELNSDDRPDDLLLNAIHVEDGGDGVFGPGDYFVFYAVGPHVWKYNTAGSFYYHQQHLYSDTSYYFINVNPLSPSPNRVGTQASSGAGVTHTVTTFDDYAYTETNTTNFVNSGREWYGELFDFEVNQSFVFSFPNIEVSAIARLKGDFASYTPGSTGSSSFSTSVAGSAGVMNVSISSVGSGGYAPDALTGSGTLNFTPNASDVTVNIQYNKYTSTSKGWLNYLELNVRRQLTYISSPLFFRDKNSVASGAVAEFQLSNPLTGLHIWEITDPSSATEQQYVNNGSYLSFVQNTDQLREFVAFRLSDVTAEPFTFGQVENQNLHGMASSELIIISHSEFLNQANRLAQFHQSEGTTAQVVEVHQIYNEFSSGMRDATAIKQFLRMFYERAGGDPTQCPKYVVLFGDGSYNNRGGTNGNSAFIPTYQSYNSTHVTISFVTDDYFVLLDPAENMYDTDGLDIALGRLPVQTQSEAEAVVNKIIAYSTNKGSVSLDAPGCCNNQTNDATLGDWRNWYTFIADDEDANNYVSAAEEFADSLKILHPYINVKKVFLDGYLQESTPGGERYPDVNQNIKDYVQTGSLVVNYIGHGGEVGWAHERILDVATINAWTNAPRLPLFMTATCEFSRFDDPGRTSAGEYVLLNENGGGIALLTTSRLVYSTPNEKLNRNFNRYVLQKVNGEPKTIGDVFLQTKNATIVQFPTTNTRNFILLGDPAVRLQVPYHNVKADSVNHVAIGSGVDTMKALSVVTIHGHVEDYLGNTLTGFNGVVYPTVYDKEQTLYTLANDFPNSSVMPYDVRKNIIFRGKASVTNGYFSFSFVVPKDIAFQYGAGKLSFYAHNGTIDAAGYDLTVTVGGTNDLAVNDTDPPVVELFMNDENFVAGGITDENPNLFAKVLDSNGVNTVGTGIGHDLTAILDGNSSDPIVLNDYYTSDANTYQSGVIMYPFTNLAEGSHTLELRVWDVYNNSSVSSTEFVVAKSAEVALQHVLNYPNPFTTRTQFMFEHNQSCSTIEVQIQVFTVSGKLVKTIQQTTATDGYKIDPIEWDGKDDFGDKLAIGTYIYRVAIQTEDGQYVEKFEKLVILN
jgi:hypothetical protein